MRHLKEFAFVGMFLGHLSLKFGYPVLNYSFFFWVAPTFAALVAYNSIRYSKDLKAYSLRLFSWGLISQFFFCSFMGGSWLLPNILIKLSVIPLVISILTDTKQAKSRFPSWVYYAAYPAHLFIIQYLF
jgi:hypothetical protein